MASSPERRTIFTPSGLQMLVRAAVIHELCSPRANIEWARKFLRDRYPPPWRGYKPEEPYIGCKIERGDRRGT